MLSDIQTQGRIMVLVLMDLSAAFDPVDYKILKQQESCVGLVQYLTCLKDREFFVLLGNFPSEWTEVRCGMPQGSIFGTLLFNICMFPLARISYHSYADKALYCKLVNPYTCLCIEQINAPKYHNFLQQNRSKTCGSLCWNFQFLFSKLLKFYNLSFLTNSSSSLSFISLETSVLSRDCD